MTRRTEQLASVIQEEITTLLAKGRLKDPRIHELTTITGAKVSRDLSIATVYFTVLEDTDIEATARGLEAAAGYIQRHLARHMRVRVIPRVRFEYDPSVAYGARMDRLLSELPELREGRGRGESPKEEASERDSEGQDASE